ncbi:MAG: hypothetical protein HWD60_12130 [Defluviicoccus sp.]|nr:MAG: hypothetical protein HWD60_12130 [Defluviicoccus sp.]
MPELSRMDYAELEVALQEWKRWRHRVMTAETMRLRVERFEQASAAITEIEQEMLLRSPEARERLRTEAISKMRDLADQATVPLQDYRLARLQYLRVEQRRGW